MDQNTLEKEVQRLLDIEEIKELKYTYCEICDDHHNPDRICSLFTEDGVWDGSECYCGTFAGHEEIRAGFAEFGPALPFSQHNMLAPRIKVDGDKATGTWYLVGMFRAHGKEPYTTVNVYYDEYAKVDGKWLIKSTKPVARDVFNYAKDSFKG